MGSSPTTGTTLVQPGFWGAKKAAQARPTREPSMIANLTGTPVEFSERGGPSTWGGEADGYETNETDFFSR